MPTIKDYRERQVYIDKANEIENQYGIPHNLLVGLLKTESGFDKDVISGKRKSSAGAIGIAQFMKATAKEFGIDPTDPIASIEAAGKYLSNNYKKLGNWDDTLRSYNLGLGGVNKWKAGKRNLPKETQDYVGKVYKNAKIKQEVAPSQTPISDAVIAQANTYFEELPTTDVKDLQNTEEIVNFEAEPEESAVAKDKDIEEVQKQTNEYNFLEEYKALVNQQQPETIVQQEIVQPQEPQQSLTDIYNQVSEFVDAPVLQEGGKIYVGNENDPRYKAYLDSLKLYQGTQRTLQELNSKQYAKEGDQKIGFVPVNALDRANKNSLVGFGNNKKEDDDWFLRYDKQLNLQEAKDYLKTVPIKPEKFFKSVAGSDYYRPIYKKPQEEVIVKEKAPIIDFKNTLNSAGLVSINPNNTFPQEEILNQYIQPRYWDIRDTVNQNFGRTQTNYRVTPETADYMLNTVAPNPYNSRTVTPQYQQGGSIQDSQEFLKNWYQNRVLPDPELNQIYQSEKQQYINQSQNLPAPNYVSQIDTANTQGTYDYRTENINLLKTASPYVYTHEGTHKINLPLKDTQSNVRAFQTIGENVIPRENIQNEWVKENYPQISNYQEIIPRLNSYRQKYGLQPNQVITPELIKSNRETYKATGDYEDNADQLYKLFQDEGLSNVLNKVVSTDNRNNSVYAQQGALVDNLKRDFGNNTKQMYLPEGSAAYKKYKEQDKYYNPEKRQGITTGDWKQDLLYENDWLLNTPFVGQYIKDEAKKVAKASEGQPFMSPEEAEKARNEDPTRKEYKAKNSPDSKTKGATLLDQYFSEKPLYPSAKYKPNSDYLEFLPTYSVKENFEKDPAKQKVFNQELMNFMFQGNKEGYNNFIKDKKPVYRRAKDGSEVADLLEIDLGGHKTGAAWDEEINLPYVSISDAWDFEPKAYAKKWDENSLSDKDADTKTNEERSFIQSFLMHKSGQPFKIYDRFYFDPKTKKYIPDSEIDKLRPKKQEGGKIVKDNNGYWNPDNWGKSVEIDSPYITMKGVKEPLFGVSNQTGEQKLMMPEKEYIFKDTEQVTEHPLTENEKEFLKHIAKTK